MGKVSPARIAFIAVILVTIAAAAVYWFALRSPTVPPAAAAPPPAEVGVATLVSADVPLPLLYAGRVTGFRIVEIRSQVGGFLQKRQFTDGEAVKAGDVLFRIDPRSYDAALARAKAQEAQAQATLTQATENFTRVEGLAARQVSTQKALEDATAARELATAALASAKADVQTAELNLEYTVIRAPIAGLTSIEASPPEGTLVQPQQTVLTRITQLDPAYVYFTTTDGELRELTEINRKRAKPLTEDDVTVKLRFGNGDVYPFDGRVDISSSIVDPRTGTIQIRAVFPNDKRGLLPGQFVRVEIIGVTMPNAVLVPKTAIVQGPQGAAVYVLDANDVAQARPVQLDREVEKGWIVKSGLKAGERVVTDGVIRVRPGAKVKPVDVTTAPAPAALPAASGTRP
ncbi:efflux RND transporter periplasmic adaptor subunit [Reyranella sp.]|uniref:efflux RND transporter periplasmic adaptor subunit n=1 Tax=Reyranella sp. TaxID=1929291 RepID=UPI003BAD67BA